MPGTHVVPGITRGLCLHHLVSTRLA